MIRQSRYSDIVDCLDVRIRQAASHNGVTFDRACCNVKFSGGGTDSDGKRRFDDYELGYVQASDTVRKFTEGFVPGILVAFGMQHEVQLLATAASTEYQELLLLIDNEVIH